MMFEYVEPTNTGRAFEENFLVRLGDANPAGVARIDGIARFLQDIATDDAADTGVVNKDIWVVRRTSIRVAPGGRWPRYLEPLRLRTWCAGTGAAWAERRTNVYSNDELLLEAAGLWVPIDQSGHPLRIRKEFIEVYGEAMQGRKVSGRVPAREVAPEAELRTWTLRQADLDVIGHVNNAAIWQAVNEELRGEPQEVTVIHHGSIENGDAVTIATTNNEVWLLVDGDVRVAAAIRY